MPGLMPTSLQSPIQRACFLGPLLPVLFTWLLLKAASETKACISWFSWVWSQGIEVRNQGNKTRKERKPIYKNTMLEFPCGKQVKNPGTSACMCCQKGKKECNIKQCLPHPTPLNHWVLHTVYLFFFLHFFFFLKLHPWHMEVPRPAVGLHHSHSNSGSKLCLRPTPQLMAMLDPQPTEQGRGSNPHPHQYQSESFLLCHRDSLCL